MVTVYYPMGCVECRVRGEAVAIQADGDLHAKHFIPPQ
jgi:hypothetical protein